MSDRKAYSPSQHYMDRFLKAHTAANARAEKRRTKEFAEQQDSQEIQAVKEKIQQQLLTIADLKAQIAVFQNTDNGSDSIITKTTSTIKTTKVTNTTTDTLSADEEQYRTTLITNMIQLIHSKRKMK